MIGLPKSTEFNRRIPKQKFYENISVSPTLKRVFIDQIKVIYWRKSEPILTLCEKFNKETDDGRNMEEVSQLLSDAINSIIDVKEESDIDSLFSTGGTSALMSQISGLDDFELICFLVVK